MQSFNLSVLMWKWVLSVLVFFSVLFLVSELRYAVPSLIEGRHGSLGVVLEDQAGLAPAGQDSNKLKITQLTSTSPLLELPTVSFSADTPPDPFLLDKSADIGDVVSFRNPIDRWRKFNDGEEVTLILVRNGIEREVQVVARAVPITLSEYVDYVSRAVLVLPALFFSLLIGFKGANDPANRRLAMTFIALALGIYYNFNYSPGNAILEFNKISYLATFTLTWFGAASFALSYRNAAIASTNPEQRPTKRNDWLMRLYPWYRAIAIIQVVYSIWFAIGYEARGLWGLGFLCALCGLLMFLISLTDGWRRTKGEYKQRHLWLLFSVLAYALPSFFWWIPAFDWTVRGVLVMAVVSSIGQFIMYIGLTYAVLKHRIFNFNFAISRALLTSSISLILLGVFELIKLFVEEFLSGDSGAESTLHRRDLVIAVFLFLAFHKMHDRVKHFLERFFFRSWYENEQRLRKFLKDAAFILSIDNLLEALVAALDHFTKGAATAIYLVGPDETYKLVAGNMTNAPPLMDADDGLLVALRSEMAAVQPQDATVQSVLSYELVLPMNHRGHLSGFVVLGSKGSGASYRPDELAILSFAVHQVGLDLVALRVTALENEVQQLELQTQKQKTALELMAGRRKHVREIFNPGLDPEQSLLSNMAIERT